MGEDESRRTRLLWLDAARYVVAALVTTLTIAVIAWGIVQFQRPEELYLRVAGGYVTIGKIRSTSPPVSVNVSLDIKAINPGGRAAILYHNVTLHFLYDNSSDITYLDLDDILVPPQIEKNDYISSSDLMAPGDVSMDFVRKMFKGHEIKNTTLRLEGTIQTQTSALNFTGSRFTMYHCSPVTIGTSSLQNEADDVPCTVG